MRELENDEFDVVAGGFPGWKIPFGGNNFLPGQPARLYPANAVVIAAFSFEAGWALGNRVNQFNQSQFGMSLGQAIYRNFNGGSHI